MSAPLTADAPLRGPDDLLIPFHQACKATSQFRVGTEAEKFGLLSDTFAPLPFEGPRSVRRVLDLLAERHGWEPEREHDKGQVISLRRAQASITLEPAGQLELSGAPFKTIHETQAEFDAHLRELSGMSEELGIVWLSVGFHPFARHEDLPHVPKLRYGIMESYLPTRGPRALDMMRRTCTVQANLDYENETDAVRKLRVSLAAQPIVTAMFANSPLYEGRNGANLCERGAVWLGMDPDRSGVLPFAWEGNMSFQKYVDWALDVPMFMIKRGGRVISNTQQTFRRFLRDGSSGERATLHDWETHINTLFPEARLKNTIEVRGADAQPTRLTCALPALWKGLLYDARALGDLETLISPLDSAQLTRARPEIVRLALNATLGGRPMQAWAEDLIAIARGGLQRIADRNPAGQDETIYLDPLSQLIARRTTSAELLRTAVSNAPDFRLAAVQATRV
jgi:glutamate--cysteine ligase